MFRFATDDIAGSSAAMRRLTLPRNSGARLSFQIAKQTFPQRRRVHPSQTRSARLMYSPPYGAWTTWRELRNGRREHIGCGPIATDGLDKLPRVSGGDSVWLRLPQR